MAREWGPAGTDGLKRSVYIPSANTDLLADLRQEFPFLIRKRLRVLAPCIMHAEPCITGVGAAKAVASGSLPWRAHDQEEHL